ncbi:hypothetical protein IFT95_09810 [Pantoea agglomerans]|uniref:hypothetical protein n=1 Tax=Enterobacter agglomerans TaxID=549 RepID=UPI0017870420|nr:hypothetical protein [Pantoea agglomerans]MBD8242489.1 hypothetical protein [Pantoea agglomerans]
MTGYTRGRDFLVPAEKCLELEHEAGYRSAISRAYYAYYHEVCLMLRNCPPTTHDGVVNYLLNDARRKSEPYPLLALVQLGAVLRQQKVKRKKADYHLDQPTTPEESRSSVDVARKMIARIDELVRAAQPEMSES